MTALAGRPAGRARRIRRALRIRPEGRGRRASAPGAARPPAGNGWRASLPDLAVAISFVLVVTVAVYAYAATGAAVLSLLVLAVIVLVLLRLAVPAAPAAPVQQDRWNAGTRTSFTGFWRRRRALEDAAASLAAYDSGLRLTLQHLLAARLAERHDVSLYADPATARRLLSGDADRLWFWLDPERPAETNPDKPGIPLRSLSAIIDRLEQL